VLDPKLLRSDLTGVAAQLARRGFVLDVVGVAAIEERRKAAQIERTGCAPSAMPMPRRWDSPRPRARTAPPARERASPWRALEGVEPAARAAAGRAREPAAGLAQYPARERARRARRDGERRGAPLGRAARFEFEPKDHVAIGERLGMDFEAAGASRARASW
jgi:seryl-tRNA synthetase